jgi:hypothetical protein
LDRWNYNIVCGIIASHDRDKKRLQVQIDEIIKPKRLGAMPHALGDKGKTDSEQEQAIGRVEKFLMQSHLAQRVSAVDMAFNELRFERNTVGWLEAETERLIAAIKIQCQNRKIYSFYGLKNYFRLACSERSFKRYKHFVLLELEKKLDL